VDGGTPEIEELQEEWHQDHVADEAEEQFRVCEMEEEVLG